MYNVDLNMQTCIERMKEEKGRRWRKNEG